MSVLPASALDEDEPDGFQWLISFGRASGITMLGYDSARTKLWIKMILVLISIIAVMNEIYSMLWTDHRFVRNFARSSVLLIVFSFNRLAIYVVFWYARIFTTFSGHLFRTAIQSVRQLNTKIAYLSGQVGHTQDSSPSRAMRLTAAVWMVAEGCNITLYASLQTFSLSNQFTAAECVQFAVQNVTHHVVVYSVEFCLIYFSRYIALTAHRYEQLVSYLVSGLNHQNQGKENGPDLVGELYSVYCSLWETYRMIATMFRWLVLLTTINLLVLVSTEGMYCFETALSVPGQAHKWNSIPSGPLMCFIQNSTFLLLICHFSESMNSAKHAISLQFRRVEMSQHPKGTQHHPLRPLAKLVKNWEAEPMFLTGCDYFYLNKSLLVSVLGAAITYAVILLQADLH